MIAITRLPLFILLTALLLPYTPITAFLHVRRRTCTSDTSTTTTTKTTICRAFSDAARELLYQDQQDAMFRRSIEEEVLLNPRTLLLQAPKLKAITESGSGFATKSSKGALLAKPRAKFLKRDGVLLVENVLSDDIADQLRVYVLKQQKLAQNECLEDPRKARSFYGVEQARSQRCDLQLSLLRGGYKADGGEKNADEDDTHVLADALQEILGRNGSLRDLYETLVTPLGEFYELAAVVTHPGSHRQIIHSDLPFQKVAPLYVVFLALQDVTPEMGPTSFLLKTHSNDNYSGSDISNKNAILAAADCRLSCLKKGDAVVFDARILHCGNANSSKDKPRALFNFSFRNPKVCGNLGYEGSIRPGYEKAMSLQDVSRALEAYGKEDKDPFLKYGSGM